MGWIIKQLLLSYLGAYFANEIGHVEDGHDEDGEPLAQCRVADLGLQAGKQAQCDEVGDGNGQHVGPNHTRDHIPMQEHIWKKPKG